MAHQGGVAWRVTSTPSSTRLIRRSAKVRTRADLMIARENDCNDVTNLGGMLLQLDWLNCSDTLGLTASLLGRLFF